MHRSLTFIKKNRTHKYILKKAELDIIPDELLDHKKRGLGIYIHEWSFDQLGEKPWEIPMDFCDQTNFSRQAGGDKTD